MAAVQNWFDGQWTLLAVLGIIVALTIDVSPVGGRKKSKSAGLWRAASPDPTVIEANVSILRRCRGEPSMRFAARDASKPRQI